MSIASNMASRRSGLLEPISPHLGHGVFMLRNDCLTRSRADDSIPDVTDAMCFCDITRSRSTNNLLSMGSVTTSHKHTPQLSARTAGMCTLNTAQKTLLRQSWQRTNKAGGPSGIGVMIFRNIFESCPEVKDLFGFGSIPISQLNYDKAFRKHAAVFVKVLSDVVLHLDTLDRDVTPKLIDYGRHHVQFQGAGFSPKYWDVFADAMTQTTIHWTFPGRSRREIIKAWTVLVSYIIDKMRHGFQMEKRKLQKEVSNSTKSQSA